MLLLALWLLVRFDRSGRRRTLILAGLVLGLATLTREMSLAWALVAAAWVALRPHPESRFRNTLCFLAALALPVLPWTLRNYGLHGSFVLVSTTRWYPVAEGNLLASGEPLASRVALIRELRRDYYGSQDELAREQEARGLALATIAAEQPTWLLRKLAWNSYLLLAPTRTQMRRFSEHGWLPPHWTGWGPPLATAESLALVVSLSLGLAGLWLVPGGAQKKLAVGLLLVFFAVYVAANATHRFRVPLLPVLMLSAGPLLAGQVRRDRWRLVGACAMLLAFAAIVLCDLLWPPSVPFQQY